MSSLLARQGQDSDHPSYAVRDIAAHDRAPVHCLIVPGLGNSGPDHWQSRWERRLDRSSRVTVESWDAPSRPDWVAAIEAGVACAPDPVILVGHSLGCIAIAWWAAEAPAAMLGKVRAGLLVAPPDLGQQGADLRLLRFAPAPVSPLPFPSLVVASANDRYAALTRSRALADAWGARFADVGRQGHINADAGLADWREGQGLLVELARSAGCDVAFPVGAEP